MSIYKILKFVIIISAIIIFKAPQSYCQNVKADSSSKTNVADSSSQANVKPYQSIYYNTSTTYSFSSNSYSSVQRLVWRHTLPYLKTDPEAMSHIRKKRVMTVGAFVFYAGAAYGLYQLISASVKSDGEKAAKGAIIFVPSATLCVLFTISIPKQIRTAVKTYNKNAGYGYVDGLND